MSELPQWLEAPRKVPHIMKSDAFLPGLAASVAIFPGIPIGLGIAIAMTLDGGVEGALEGFAIFGVILFAAYQAFKAAMKARKELNQELQQERDEFAEGVSQILLTGGKPPPFSLYLRPFFTDGHLTADEGVARIATLDPEEIADVGQKRDLERAAAKALEDHAPLISLGRPNDRLGAGRIETGDENWKHVFDLLIANASRVIIVPIGQPATMDEIRHIAATPALRAKTIFVRPSDRRNSTFTFTPDPSAKSIGKMWDWTKAQLGDVLPQFPAFRGGPRLITFPPDKARVEYAGNGICSVQQPSGIRHFLTNADARTLDWLLVLTLFLTMGFVRMGPIHLGFGDLGSLYSYNVDRRAIEGVVGRQVVRDLLTVPLVLIGIYKLWTGDLPRRLALPTFAALILVAVSWTTMSLWQSYIGEWDRSLADQVYSLFNFVSRFTMQFFTYAAVTLLLNRYFNWRHLTVLASVALLLTAFGWMPFPSADDPANIPAWETILRLSVAATALVVPLCLPVLSSLERRHWWKLALGALVVSALCIAINSLLWTYWLADIFTNAYIGSLSSCDPACQLDTEWKLASLRYAASLLISLPILIWPFVLRWKTSIGSRISWNDPLEPYPT